MKAHRLMRRPDTGSVVKVFAWGVTMANGWEYYFLDPMPKRQPMALVLGFEDEMGSVDMEELKPHLSSYATGAELNDIAPATGWEWVS